MSFHSWLQNLRSALAPRRGQRHHGRQGSLRAPSHRPYLEVLEDRLTPSFSPATSFPVAPTPLAVVSADFNGDNNLDLATANPAGSVSVLLGDGAGGFGAAIIGPGAIIAPGTPGGDLVSLAVADFNNDGHLDLAMAIHGLDEFGGFGGVGVLLGNGDGTFRAATYPFNNGVVSSVVVGDFNNDGNSDLVVGVDPWGDAFIGHVELLPGNGQGGFTWTGFGSPVSSGNLVQAVGDLNRDGNLDVVLVAGAGGPGGDVLLGNGAGLLFSSNPYYSTTPNARAVAIGDFTGDGILDLVVAGDVWYPDEPNGVDIVTGRGNGTFYSPIAHSANGYEHTGVAVADFNGDGHLDAVTSDADTGTVSELLGNGNGTLTYAAAYAVGSSPMAVAVGDFNGDGRPDVATANGGSNTVSVLLNDGSWTPPPPTVSIRDVTVTEGNTGTTAADFVVSLSAPSTETITVAYATADWGATAGSDYQAASGTLTFAPGETSKTITVPVNGDRLAEPNETFVVNFSAPTNATIADGQGVGTILDDEPRMSINDVTVTEGNTGAVNATFTVSLAVAYDVAVTVHYQTANGSATAGSDYAAASGDVIIAAGQTSQTFTVAVIGDRSAEPTENFVVNLSAATNGLIVDSQGVGTILDNEPRISISDVTKIEGKKGQTTLFTFTVTLSAAYDQAVTMSFSTLNGTATTSDNDYAAKTGTLTFAPGETTKTITISIKGDSKKEGNEYFYVDLFDNSGNLLFTKNRGVGTILNDD